MAGETTRQPESEPEPDAPVSRRRELLAQLNPLRMDLRYRLGLLGLVVMALVPTQMTPLDLSPLVGLVFLMMFAMSWDAVSGYTGQLSFGHAFFFAVGGYGSAVLNLQHGLHPLVSIPVATLLAAVGGVLVGLPALRLRGPYLSLVTLIVPLIMAQLFILWNDSLVVKVLGFELPVAPDGFGGRSGLPAAPDPIIAPSPRAVVEVPGFQMQVLGNYYLALGLLVVILVVLLAVTRSTAGSVFTAIREDENAVATAGLNPEKFKLFAFVLSGAVGGLAGAVFVHTLAGYPQPPSILNIDLSINVIVMSILGGMGTIVGPIVGAAFFGVMNAVLENVQTLPVIGAVLQPVLSLPVVGGFVGNLLKKPLPLLAAAMVVLFYMPEGILPASVRIGRNVLARVRGEETQGRVVLADTPLGTVVETYREELDEIVGKRGDEK